MQPTTAPPIKKGPGAMRRPGVDQNDKQGSHKQPTKARKPQGATREEITRAIELLQGGALKNQHPVLFGIPAGSKGTKEEGRARLRTEHMTPAYIESLVDRNVAVMTGSVSGGIKVIDIDRDDLVEPFLQDNPRLCDTLRTFGSRGQGFWVVMPDGPCTRVTLKLNGEPIGELNGGGNCYQVICGEHPDAKKYPDRYPTGLRYRIVNDAEPITISVNNIDWTALTGRKSFSGGPVEGAQQELRTTSSEPGDALNHGQIAPDAKGRSAEFGIHGVQGVNGIEGAHGTHGNQVVVELIKKIIAHPAVNPTARGQTHGCLWTLARMAKPYEFSNEQLLLLFRMWADKNAAFLNPEKDVEGYFVELLEALGDVAVAFGDEPMQRAWKAAQEQPAPPEIVCLFKDPKMRLLVALCFQLQLIWGDRPFPLSGEKANEIVGLGGTTEAWRKLKVLRKLEIIQLVEPGTRGSRGKAATYCYIGPSIHAARSSQA